MIVLLLKRKHRKKKTRQYAIVTNSATALMSSPAQSSPSMTFPAPATMAYPAPMAPIPATPMYSVTTTPTPVPMSYFDYRHANKLQRCWYYELYHSRTTCPSNNKLCHSCGDELLHDPTPYPGTYDLFFTFVTLSATLPPLPLPTLMGYPAPPAAMSSPMGDPTISPPTPLAQMSSTAPLTPTPMGYAAILPAPTGYPTPSVSAPAPMGYPAIPIATFALTGNPAFPMAAPAMIGSLASPATAPASPSYTASPAAMANPSRPATMQMPMGCTSAPAPTPMINLTPLAAPLAPVGYPLLSISTSSQVGYSAPSVPTPTLTSAPPPASVGYALSPATVSAAVSNSAPLAPTAPVDRSNRLSSSCSTHTCTSDLSCISIHAYFSYIASSLPDEFPYSCYHSSSVSDHCLFSLLMKHGLPNVERYAK
ncbi:Uncharacterized protein APZ42_012896 [Daphnia magna]|uniref:Uncharacterized protein n=1 Tax=Daphnia magna TaxID=35525 RepID=A0A0P5SYJ1_9CRUS|nr:Uncharacterized protein APZ42_012896 [Daphnia magna]